MSLLMRILRAPRAPIHPSTPLASFHTTSIRRALGERDLAHTKDRPSEEVSAEIEKDKQDSVSKAKQGKGEWKEELASDSEESVAGDRSKLSMEEMEKLGEEQAKKES